MDSCVHNVNAYASSANDCIKPLTRIELVGCFGCTPHFGVVMLPTRHVVKGIMCYTVFVWLSLSLVIIYPDDKRAYTRE